MLEGLEKFGIDSLTAGSSKWLGLQIPFSLSWPVCVAAQVSSHLLEIGEPITVMAGEAIFPVFRVRVCVF